MANDLEKGLDSHLNECNGCIPVTKLRAPKSWTNDQQEAVGAILSGYDAPESAPVSKFPKGFDWALI